MTKRLNKISIILILLITSCNNLRKNDNIEKTDNEPIQKKYQEIIPNKLVYEFINNVLLKENKIYQSCENLLNKNYFIDIKGDSTLISKIDTLFSKEDKDFIKAQYLNANNFVLDPKLIKEKKLIKLDTTINSKEDLKRFWQNVNKKYNCVGFIRVPIFNKKRDTVIVQVSYNCGAFCAEGATYIYKLNENNRWELLITFDKWIS
ncbi:hypothetical protein FCR2A7T_06750 [Flavobacterium cauense R2A-7]|uniref:Uncharacterized protein n=1 Tax=Flavobacterium cauense R2A-7 TaxID=1341154 RepID=V6S3I9_9FLAO|nr:hypothetical protein [Flavobacterium cauense]ESU21248.1 hypothetical protein FCR2A7T_06750 [Flavobacterium cauense R2A-7]KGO79302.1 hypothetical protein Q762_14510 [Flavobacterium cauense R2A-7]TWI07386.1 hypothetical protein IP98_02961 [Flavobacterium cauense R2A-7]